MISRSIQGSPAIPARGPNPETENVESTGAASFATDTTVGDLAKPKTQAVNDGTSNTMEFGRTSKMAEQGLQASALAADLHSKVPGNTGADPKPPQRQGVELENLLVSNVVDPKDPNRQGYNLEDVIVSSVVDPKTPGLEPEKSGFYDLLVSSAVDPANQHAEAARARSRRNSRGANDGENTSSAGWDLKQNAKG